MHKVTISDAALTRLKAIAVAALQVRQDNVSREEILKTLSDIPIDVAMQVVEDIERIKNGETVII